MNNYFLDISFNLSAKKSHSFLLALVQARGKLVSYTTLQNGFSSARVSKHEFIGRLAFDNIHDVEKFNELFIGESESTERAGGCAC
jgi:hypothetical protein